MLVEVFLCFGDVKQSGNNVQFEVPEATISDWEGNPLAL